jgi:transposase-like protein
MKKIIATLVTAVVLGASGLAVASAASPSPSTSTAAPKAAHSGARAGLRKIGFEAAAKAIGLSPADLLKAMEGGHSIAAVATSHSVAVQTVIDAAVKAIDARVQQGVDSGKITSDQATKIEAAVALRVPKFVNATPKQLIRHRVRRGAFAVSAKTIGVTPEVLRQALVSGQSVADVATAHSVDPATVVSALVTAGDARIDKAVANHHLDAARAAKLKARLPQLAQRFVDRKRDAAKAPTTAHAAVAA